MLAILITLGLAPFVFGAYFLFVARYDGEFLLPRSVRLTSVGVALVLLVGILLFDFAPVAVAAPFMVVAGFSIMRNPRSTVYHDQQTDPFTLESRQYDDESDVPFYEVAGAWIGGGLVVLVGLYLLVEIVLSQLLGIVVVTPGGPGPMPPSGLLTTVACSACPPRRPGL